MGEITACEVRHIASRLVPFVSCRDGNSGWGIFCRCSSPHRICNRPIACVHIQGAFGSRRRALCFPPFVCNRCVSCETRSLSLVLCVSCSSSVGAFVIYGAASHNFSEAFRDFHLTNQRREITTERIPTRCEIVGGKPMHSLAMQM